MSARSTVSRRRFLAASGAALGAGVLGCGGLAATVGAEVPALNYGQSICPKGGSMDPILVTYASRYGSTAEVAQAIGAQLCARGEAVEVQPVEDVQDVRRYRAVVAGSAIRIGAWLPAAVKFVRANRDALSRVPVAYFAVHILNLDDSTESRQARSAYLDPVRKVLTPQHEAFFAGKIDPGKLNFGDGLLNRLANGPQGDLRDWQAIRNWADQIFHDEGAVR